MRTMLIACLFLSGCLTTEGAGLSRLFRLTPQQEETVGKAPPAPPQVPTMNERIDAKRLEVMARARAEQEREAFCKEKARAHRRAHQEAIERGTLIRRICLSTVDLENALQEMAREKEITRNHKVIAPGRVYALGETIEELRGVLKEDKAAYRQLEGRGFTMKACGAPVPSFNLSTCLRPPRR